MTKKSASQSAFFKLRVLLASVSCLAGALIALGGADLYLGSSKAQAQPVAGSAPGTANSRNGPDIVRLVGPVCGNTDLRNLPYIPPAPQILKQLLVPHPWAETGVPSAETPRLAQLPALITGILRPLPTMSPPLLTFDGVSFVEGGGLPPDTNGDVGPNHYVQAVNLAFKVFDKNGNTVRGPTTFNSFFAPLGDSTPCGLSQQKIDPVVFYDQIADRWVVTVHAEDWDATTFWECIGVSQTGDPVAGGWCLYALEDDPGNPTRMGDYPKFGLWPDAYYLTMDEPSQAGGVAGVRVYALDRASMIGGGPTNAVGFTIDRTALGDSHGLVPASFRTGAPPPSGRQEFLLAIDDPLEGVTQTHVKGWLFHVDFIHPNNSTLGIGLDHSPNAQITVNEFINGRLVPQQGTLSRLDALGDRIMTPLVYQNRNGTESLWADHTIILNYPVGPNAIRWYQFDVTGGNFPSTPVQQQDWSNGNDGLWRWMPSIAVDQNGNTAIGYSISSPSMFPGIRYAGRFATDPLNDLGQGEAIMTNGGGSETELGRWGDYSMTTVDSTDGISFWHTNEYFRTTARLDWSTRVGKFQFPAPTSRSTPTPRPRPTPAPRPTPL